MEQEMNKKLDDMMEVLVFIKDHGAMQEEMDARFVTVDKRFDGVNKRFDTIEGRLDEIENDMRAIRADHETTANIKSPHAG